MKLIIDLDEYDYSTIVNDERYMPLDISVAIKNGTPIPDNATNDDVLQIVFKERGYMAIHDRILQWLFAPYQKGDKE